MILKTSKPIKVLSKEEQKKINGGYPGLIDLAVNCATYAGIMAAIELEEVPHIPEEFNQITYEVAFSDCMNGFL